MSVSKQVPVSKEDTELLIKMASGYLHGVGGTPQIQAQQTDDAIYFSVAGMDHGKGSPPIRSEQLDKDYARNSIVRVLKESGMHYGMVGVAKKPLPVLREDSKSEGDDPGSGQPEEKSADVPRKARRTPRPPKIDPIE